MIEFKNVSYTYYDEQEEENDSLPVPTTVPYAIEDINIKIAKGEFTTLIGRNGSGKSTMARLMNALLLPSEGNVLVEGIDTLDDESIWNIRKRVGMIFQNPDNQIIGTSVEEDVAFGPENLGIPRAEMLKRINWALETVGIEDLRRSAPHMLSGGQKQRVAIAGILAMKPEYIVLDESTAMLDPVGRRDVMNVVRRLNKENGMTVVHITHHMDEACMADKVILIDKGHVIKEGTPKEIFSDETSIKEAGLETPQVTQLFNALNRSGLTLPCDVISIDEAAQILEPLIDKSKIHADSENKDIRRNDVAIKAEHVSYTYMKGTPFEKEALKDVSFEIYKGEFIGIIGHTGCGKSTLLQHLNALLRPLSGEIYINGTLIDKNNSKSIRRKVGLVFQYPEYQLFEATVYRDIAFGLKQEKLTPDEERERVIEAAKIVGLSEDILENSIYDLSGGQKRRVAIAGIIVMRPDILILDEPAAGLDPAGRDEILSFARSLRDEHGKTVILVSHSMDDVARLADRIIVMNESSIDMIGTPDEIFQNEERLNAIGLTLPQLTTLVHKLGIEELHMNALSPEKLAEILLRGSKK